MARNLTASQKAWLEKGRHRERPTGPHSGDFEFEVKGLDELFRFFDTLPDQMQIEFVDKTMTQAGELLAKQARLNCPVHTGKLRNSIKVKRFKRQGVNDVSVGTNIKYARYVEYGSGRHLSGDRDESEEYTIGPRGERVWRRGIMTTKKGKQVMWIAANPFMRMAMHQVQKPIADMMKAALERFVAQQSAGLGDAR